MTFTEEVLQYCKAGIPVYYILTEDESSTIKDLKEVCNQYCEGNIEDTFIIWTAKGDDPIELLEKLQTEKFVVLINPHLTVLSQPDFIQTIKDMIPVWKGARSKVFLVCNDRKIPTELNRDMVYLEYGLPDRNTIKETLEFIKESVAGQIELNYNEEELIQSALGLTSGQAEDSYSLSLIRDRNLDSKTVTRYKANEYLKTGIMELEEPKSPDSFKGYENVKSYIRLMTGSFFKPSKYNLPAPKGILLIGVPGTGKTLLSRVIAAELNLMLLKCDLGKVFSQYVGESEKNMRMFINVAEKMSPVVMRLDEIEKQMSGFGGGNDTGSAVRDSTFAPFLSWLQDCTLPVYKIATANRVEALPPELLRKGRFDEIFFLDLPNEKEIIEILDYHINIRVLETELIHDDDLVEIAQYFKGFSGAEIEQVVIQSLRRYEYLGSNNDLQLIIKEEANDTTPLSILRKEDIDRIRNWAINNNAKLASANDKIYQEQEKVRKTRSIQL